MSERDELAKVIANNSTVIHDSHYGDITPDEMADEMADAILAAGYRKPRTITTAEELDEAIRGAFEEGEHLVLMTGERPWDIWEDEDGGLHVSSSPYEDDPERLTLANITLPATVLWEPR